MQWPKTLLDAFDKALVIVPVDGLDKWTVLHTMMDEATRRAIWRAAGEPGNAGAALRTPYTPLGSVINERINGLVDQLTLKGDVWGDAIHAFHDYVEDNAEAIFAAFGKQDRPYGAGLTFTPSAPPQG